MKIDLTIDQLRIPASSTLRSEDIAAAIATELDRLGQVYGLPLTQRAGGVDVDLASLTIDPRASVEEIGSSVARLVMHGLHREHGNLPWGIDSGPDRPTAATAEDSPSEVQR